MGALIKDFPSILGHIKALETYTAFDFYRCYKCRSLFTRIEEQAAFARNSGPCSCGSMKYSPASPVGFDWLRWNVVSYVLKMVLAREIAPVCERRFPFLLPIISRLV
jgi:hypothetical protein